MRGMWIWTSARSIDWCSAINCSTSSATPTSTIVAAGSSSDRVLIVSANSRRSSTEAMRSNSSMKMATLRGPASAWSPRRTSCGVASAARSAAAVTWTSRAWRREPDPRSGDGEVGLAERLSPHALEVVAPIARRARGEHVRGGEDFRRDADERGLADSALAVDDCVLAGLVGDVEQVAELSRAAREERPAIDGRRRPERLGERPQTVDLLRLPPLQPRTHPTDRTSAEPTPQRGRTSRTTRHQKTAWLPNPWSRNLVETPIRRNR